MLPEYMKKRTGLDKDTKNRSGMPNPKKFERLGKNDFVIHADGGNHFEGKITDPSKVRLKPSNRLVAFTVGVCIRKCSNRDTKCSTCFRFSEFIEEALCKQE